MDSVCSRTRAQLSSLLVPAPALLAPPAWLARDGSSLLPPSQRHEPTLRWWILGFRHVLISSPKPAKSRVPPGRSAALTIAIRRVGEGQGPRPPRCPCGRDRGDGSSCSPWSFAGTSAGGARCSPRGWGRAVSPRGLWGCMEEVPPCPTPPPFWRCSAFPEHCWCSGHPWKTSRPLAWGTGRGNQAE